MKRTHAVLWLLGMASAALLGYFIYARRHRPATPRDDEQTGAPLPHFTETRYLNAGPDARFIGSAACAQCHQRNHKSYLLTAHSKALSDVDPADEPPDASFDHK